MTLLQLRDRLERIIELDGDSSVQVYVHPANRRYAMNGLRIFDLSSVDRHIAGGVSLTVYDSDWKPEKGERR